MFSVKCTRLTRSQGSLIGVERREEAGKEEGDSRCGGEIYIDSFVLR